MFEVGGEGEDALSFALNPVVKSVSFGHKKFFGAKRPLRMVARSPYIFSEGASGEHRSKRTSYALELMTDIRVTLSLNRSPESAGTPFAIKYCSKRSK